MIVLAVYWAVWKFTEHRSTAYRSALSKWQAFALVGSAIVVETALMRIGFTFGDSDCGQMTTAPFNDPMVWNFAIPFAAAALLVVMLGGYTACISHGDCYGAVRGSAGADWYSKSGLRDDLLRRRNLWNRPLSRTAICDVGWVVCGRSKRLHGARAYRLCRTTNNFEFFSAGDWLWFCRRTADRNFCRGRLTDKRIAFWDFDRCKTARALERRSAGAGPTRLCARRAPINTRMRWANLRKTLAGQSAQIHCWRVSARFITISANSPRRNTLSRTNKAKTRTITAAYAERQDHYQSCDLRNASWRKRSVCQKRSPTSFLNITARERCIFSCERRRQQAKPGETIDEKDFRYPGPKPQFKEAAIMMLADSCEAAARSLARPDPENIRAIVVKIVDAIISDGQLDDAT